MGHKRTPGRGPVRGFDATPWIGRFVTLEVYERCLLPVVYEHWLPVTGWETSHQISCRGRLRSLDRWIIYRDGRRYLRRGQIIKPIPNRFGYLGAVLTDGHGRRQGKLIHVMVLEAFAGPCPPGMQTRHGPGGPADNRWPEVIRWGTPEDNQGPDRVRDGTSNHGERNGSAKLTEAIVRECRRRRTAGVPLKDLASEFGISMGAMSEAVNSRTWQQVS